MNPDAAVQQLVHSDIGGEGGAEFFELLENISHCRGRFVRTIYTSSQLNWSLLAVLSRLCGKKMVLNHEGQDLISSVEWFLIACQGGSILARRLGNACQKRRLVGIISSERRQRRTKIILRGRGEAVATISQVDEAGVTREQFFLGSAFGSVALSHLPLDPQREAHFLNFQQDLVGAGHTEDQSKSVREKALVLKCIASFRAGEFLQEVTADKLLSNRRAALGKYWCALCGIPAARAPETGHQGANVGLAEQPREDGIIHSRV